MCGRYNIILDAEALSDAIALVVGEELASPAFEPDYNISPSPPHANPDKLTRVPIVKSVNHLNCCTKAVWPLIPQWANGVVPKYATANARAETMATSNAYRNAWKNNQRCLVPASGFYEWQQKQGEKSKQPYHIRLGNDPLLFMAGLWEQCGELLSFTIVTTDANTLMADIHNTKKRMPLILAPECCRSWLHGSKHEAEKCIQSYPAEDMCAYPISTYVNNPGHHDAKCIEKIDG